MSINSKDLILYYETQFNRFRSKPSSFVKQLKQRLKQFKDQFTYERTDLTNITYKTQQGKKAVNEAIQFLQNKKEELQPFKLSLQLCEIAYKVSINLIKHQAGDQIQSIQKNLKEEINIINCKIENLEVMIEYGFRKDHQILPSLLVDDGNQSRSQRLALINPIYKYVGFGVQQHPEYDFVLLILMSSNVEVGKDPQANCHCSLI